MQTISRDIIPVQIVLQRFGNISLYFFIAAQDCLGWTANAIQMDRATQAIWAAINKYSMDINLVQLNFAAIDILELMPGLK